ncbi:MAG TPA: hypothetical protein VFV69_00155 [Steroidobacteraceae bacterium]|nr:hypothetical protein [Steroidobacteraceae bacterium]
MVTRSSLVWVMTGIAAGIAGGYLWNRERAIEVVPPSPAELRNEPVRSPFTQRREQRPNYLTQPEPSRESAPASSGRSTSSEFSHRQTVYESASHASLAQLDSMILEARSLANPLERRNTLEILLLRYAEIDAAGAIGKALENDRETATRLLGALAAIAPEQTWQRASEVTNAAERLAYLKVISEAWVAQDAERAFTKVTDLPADWQRAELLRSVALDIADRDPRLAIRLAQTQTASVSGALIEQIAALWSRNNPSEAARWVESLPRQEQGRYAYRVAEPYLAQKQSEALMWAQRLAGSPRKYLWSSMLGQMAKYDPDQALQLAQAADSPAARSEAMGKVLAAMAQTNPSMAMAQLLKMPQSEMRSEILGEVAQSVATLTPTAALDWLNDINDKSMRSQAAQSLGYALARRDVEAAADMIDRIPKEARASWITSVALAYADVDFEKGRQWVRRYANEPGDAAFQFARVVASRSPDQAVQLVDGIADDEERDRLLRGLIEPLAEHSPAVAARWAERVTDDQQRERAIGEVAAVWSQYDVPAARKWILSLDDGPAKDTALQQLVMRSGGGSLDDVVPLINQIQTPERRSHAVLMAAMQLSQSDMDGARTLLRRYPLDPARQRQFDEYLQRRNKGQ